MGKGTIGGKIVLEGEKQYREALKGIKADQMELRSEMRLCQSTFQTNQNSLEALSQKHEILTKQIDSQTQKVEVYQTAITNYSNKQETAALKASELQAALQKAEEEMDMLSNSSGDTTKAVEEQAKVIEDLKKQLADAEKNYETAGQKVTSYQTSLNNAQADLASMKNELEKTGQYLKEAEQSTDGCAKSIDELGKEVQESKGEAADFGDVLKANLASELIADGIRGLGDLFKNLTQETIEAAQAAADYADEIGTLSVQTGVAVDTLQALTYAEELMDVSVSTVTSSMARNIRSMNSAREGTEAYAQAYKDLGVEIVDVTTNELRDSETVFWEVVDALGEIDNASERDAIAMQLFGRSAQQLNTLVDQGSAGFQKFKTEAKAAGYVLEEDAFNALLDTSDAMERVSKKTDALKRQFGAELAPQITRLSEVASDALDEVDDELVEFASGGMDKLADGIEWIIDNSDLVITGISGITAATVYHGAVAPLIMTVTKAWKTYKESTEAATVSQWLLTTAMNASPAGLLVTGLVGLTAALTAFAIVNDKNLSVMDEVTKETNEQIEAAKKLNEQYSTAATSRATERQGLEAEAVSCKNLVTELKDLTSKTKLTNAEQARMQMIVTQLNQAMPNLNLAIDEQTGKLNMSTQALESNVDALMALARAEAAREDLSEIAEEQWETEKLLAELREQEEEQLVRLTEAQEAYNEVVKEAEQKRAEGIIDDVAGVAEYGALIKAEQAYAELQTQIEATQNTYDGFTTEYENTMSYISDTEALAEAKNATADLGASAETVGDKYESMSDEVQTALTDMQTSLTETITSQISLFEEFSGAAELTTEELLANMQSQVDGVTQWATNLALLADMGINQGLLKTLEEMGPAGAGYVATFVQMTDEELQKANELYAQSIALPEDAAETATQAYANAGTMAGEGFKTGIEESKEGATEAGADLAQGTTDQMVQTLEAENGSSKKTEEIGSTVDEGLIKGINDGEQDVFKVVENICAEVVQIPQSELNTSTFYSIGMQIPAGLERGIRAGKSGVVGAITEMCTAAIKTAKSELDINSPSKKFEYMGEMSGDGYIGGWKRSMADIDAIIAASLPDTAMAPEAGLEVAGVNGQGYGEYVAKKVEVTQEVNIYAETPNMIETTREFKRAQKEMAEEW